MPALTRRSIMLGAMAAPLVARSGAHAQTPVIKIIVPFPPGGTVDPIARMVQPGLQQRLGATIVIENKPGASGSIGTALAAKSPPDGSTWVFVFDTHAVNPFLQNLAFDTERDLDPVLLIGTAPNLLATHPSRPFNAFADVIAAAKAKPDTLGIGNVGNGSLGHLASILVNQAAGIKLVAIPYKGGGPLSTDVMGGQIDFAMASTAAQAAHVKSGKMRALALTGEKRSHTMPDVPTLGELGMKWEPAYAFWGILAPAGTPKPIIDKISAELVKAIKEPGVNKTLTETLGMDVLALSPEATGKFIADAIQRWGKVVRDNNIRAE